MSKIHFIGSSGVSMSALRELANNYGHTTTGSDIKENGHKLSNITQDLDLVVYTSAITPESDGYAELAKAKELKIKTLNRGEYLATIANNASNSIVVSGMHGKTTVTTMIGQVLMQANLNPTVIPGTIVKEFGGNLLVGSKDLIVTEGCEYYDYFLYLKPQIAIITNIEAEHLDYFKNLDEIISSFAKFISNIQDDGFLIYCAEDKNIQEAIKRSNKLPKNVISYGKGGDQKYQELAFKLKVPGSHNRLNALAALAACECLNVDNKQIEKTLSHYSGAGRRLEYKGEINGITVYDDYGHHPTEIQSTINAIKEAHPEKKLIVAFWPHQYKRLESLANDFIKVFSEVDSVWLPIYFVPGRDEKRPISSEKLVEQINQAGGNAHSFKDQESMVKYLKTNLKTGEVLLTIGIPPVYEVANKFLGEKC